MVHLHGAVTYSLDPRKPILAKMDLHEITLLKHHLLTSQIGPPLIHNIVIGDLLAYLFVDILNLIRPLFPFSTKVLSSR